MSMHRFLPQSIATDRCRYDVLLSSLMTLCLVAGCDKGADAPGAGMMGGSGGPMEVSTITIARSSITLTQDLPGRISAFRTAEVRARVDGIVQKRLFTEGSDVKEGQVLYEIEPSSYQASLDSARSTLARAEANINAARTKVNRYSKILASKAVSQQDYDDAVAMLQAYEADILAGKAAVRTAEINLSYTKVVSPISGRIGKSEVTEGAYVQAAGATLLATVQQIDQVYVDVTQSSFELFRLKKAVQSKEIQTDAAGRAHAKLLLDDGSEYADEGVLQFADATVNPATSSVMIRAVFPNSHTALLPGMFVRARLAEGQQQDAILVPQAAIQRNTKGEPTAYVIGEKGAVEVRTLDISRSVSNQWLVRSGLKVGEQLITDNLQRLREGLAVKPAAPKAAPSTVPAAPQH